MYGVAPSPSVVDSVVEIQDRRERLRKIAGTCISLCLVFGGFTAYGGAPSSSVVDSVVEMQDTRESFWKIAGTCISLCLSFGDVL